MGGRKGTDALISASAQSVTERRDDLPKMRPGVELPGSELALPFFEALPPPRLGVTTEAIGSMSSRSGLGIPSGARSADERCADEAAMRTVAAAP